MDSKPLKGEALHRQRLTSPRWEERRDSLRYLIDHRPPDLTMLLLDALTDRARGVRRLASGTLVRLGESVLDDLCAHLDDPRHGAWCTVVLAGSLAGRRRLAALPEAGLAYLREALALPDLHALQMLGVAKALAIGPMPAAADLLLPLLGGGSVLVRNAAARALIAREDTRVLDWVLAQPSWRLFTVPLIEWLGELGDPRAIAPLKRLAGWRTWLTASSEVRTAARAALSRVYEAVRHIPDGALTRANPPSSTPSAAALSLWAEDEPAAADSD